MAGWTVDFRKLFCFVNCSCAYDHAACYDFVWHAFSLFFIIDSPFRYRQALELHALNMPKEELYVGDVTSTKYYIFDFSAQSAQMFFLITGASKLSFQ